MAVVCRKLQIPTLSSGDYAAITIITTITRFIGLHKALSDGPGPERWSWESSLTHLTLQWAALWHSTHSKAKQNHTLLLIYLSSAPPPLWPPTSTATSVSVATHLSQRVLQECRQVPFLMRARTFAQVAPTDSQSRQVVLYWSKHYTYESRLDHKFATVNVFM